MHLIIRLSLLALTGFTLGLPIPAAATPAPAPEVSLSLRGVGDHTIEVGEPLFVAVRIEVPEESTAAIELAPAGGSWADQVAVGLAGLAGGSPRLPAQPVARPENAAVTLDAAHIAGGVWFLSSATTGKLAPGDYLVRAQLAIHDGHGWKGETGSDEVTVHVVAPSNKSARVMQRTIAKAYEAELTGSPQAAARLLDALLADDPDNVSLLTVRGALCARAGDYRAALACVNRAMSRLEREKWTHPPIELFELEDQVVRALMAADGTQPALPDWTRLPASVLAPQSDERQPKNAARSATRGIPDPLLRAPGTGVAPAPAQASAGAVPAVASASASGTVVPFTQLADAKVIADPAGQWAASATAGTKYGKTQYAPAQATGAPNISVPGNSPDAWCPESKNSGTDWLEVVFAKPVHATEVRVRQNDAAGAIVKIEAIEPNGASHVWWTGIDPYRAPATRELVWFAVRMPKTDYLVGKVRITLDLAAVSGWKEIDAVQLVGSAE